MTNTSPHFTVLYGPTASGKTGKALHLAEKLSGNILSFDSRQVYAGMDVVTGKDIPEEFHPVEHPHTEYESIRVYTKESMHLFGFDAVEPDQDWSIAHFYRYAQPIIAEHRERHQPLIIVGGSWQYVAALFDPPESLFVPTNAQLRQELESLSVPEIQARLQREAPQRWKSLNDSDQANPRRLIRALEVAHAQPAKPSALFTPNEANFTFFQAEMSWLEQQIQQRVHDRLNTGAIAETETLIEKFPNWNTPAFATPGYQRIRQFLENRIDRETLEEQWFRAERQYAKRQLTWLQAVGPQFPTAERLFPGATN